ncbi:STAS domain-containing protein [Nocardioides sp.]|uniref:STAS domain-containing protein n=1 Tax=Nocardioides sp. TaxID=35761 RepID=UPI002BECA18C|nr:STAS domain-containing protein [Nocardioides sp.]HXH79271.1 STAS domain-containing protein [Nocardioides sp.]
MRPDGDIDVVVLAGELDIATAPAMSSAIDRQLIQGRSRIVLDLDAVTFFDGRAIDAVITATCAAALAGGRLLVTHNPRFMALLKLTCETHRVNVTEGLLTAAPQLRGLPSETLLTREQAGAVHANRAGSVDEGSDLARDEQLPALLKRSGEGDESAFAAVYDATAARAYGLSERLLHDPALASDAVQTAYLHLWEQSARFQPTHRSAISWILLTVRRCSVARMPPTVVRMPTNLKIPILIGPASPALGMLPPIQRRVVDLVYFGGYTHTEAEEMLDLPIGDGGTQIREALMALGDLRRPLQTPGMEGAPT